MPQIKTLAVEITENTYPIAVACLPARFAMVPFSKVDGCILVINEYRAASYCETSGREILVVENGWFPKEEFEDEFRYLTPGRKGANFAEVERR